MSSDMSKDAIPVVDVAILSRIFELDADAPAPYAFSSELISSFFKSARETVANMQYQRCVRYGDLGFFYLIRTSDEQIRAVGNGASYLKGMCAQYGLRRLEHACEDAQSIAWTQREDGHTPLSSLISRLSAELDAAWDWFLQFFVEKGVEPTREDVARWLDRANSKVRSNKVMIMNTSDAC
jgi:hypothetical protein